MFSRMHMHTHAHAHACAPVPYRHPTNALCVLVRVYGGKANRFPSLGFHANSRLQEQHSFQHCQAAWPGLAICFAVRTALWSYRWCVGQQRSEANHSSLVSWASLSVWSQGPTYFTCPTSPGTCPISPGTLGHAQPHGGTCPTSRRDMSNLDQGHAQPGKQTGLGLD